MNFSVSLIDHDRFERERLIAHHNRAKRRIKTVEDEANGTKLLDLSIQDADAGEEIEETKNGFIDDLIHMLQLNKNGFLHLIIYLIHIYLLLSQTITSILYSSFPTDRDPTTEEFLNLWLRYAEKFLFVDYIYKFDQNSLYNRLLVTMTLQYIILRLRSLFIRIKAAKINRHQYRQINIVEIEVAYISEMRFHFSEWSRQISACLSHKCQNSTVLDSRVRKTTLKFNKKVRELSKLDRIYYYNQISFNNCYQGTDIFNYHREKQFKRNIQLKKIEQNLSGRENEAKEQQIGWREYLFSISLPNRSSFIGKPEHRIDLKHSIWIYLLVLVETAICLSVSLFTCSYFTYLAFFYQSDDSSLQTTVENLNSNHLLKSINQIKVFFTVFAIAANFYDYVILANSAIFMHSRSQKIINMLKQEIEFYRCHMSKFSHLYSEYKLSSDLRKMYFKEPRVESDLTNHLDGNHRVISLFQENKFTFIPGNYGAPASKYPRKSYEDETKHSFEEKTLREYYLKEKLAIDSYEEIYQLIPSYRSCLNKKSVKQFNENIDYLVDLIGVIQLELQDYKSFFTLLLDMTVVFGTIRCSISLAAIMASHDLFALSFAISTGLTNFLPIVFALFVSASIEYAVSIKR